MIPFSTTVSAPSAILRTAEVPSPAPGEVLVTARRHSEWLEKATVPILAFSPEKLERPGIKAAADLQLLDFAAADARLLAQV
jgi:hypothetical protein